MLDAFTGNRLFSRSVMKLQFILITFIPIWVTVFSLSAGNSFFELQTKAGRLMGLIQNTLVGKEVQVFLGIPYGTSTDGENRFGPPKDAKPWAGTLDATTFPGPCYQVVAKEYKNNIVASAGKETEDCLKLNIWAPKHGLQKSAVMVWIHGGGLSVGSSDIPLYNGAVLAAQENVIVVSINYRLSAFGFLYFDHPQAPGNVGLMDQALGLKWVKNNIEDFGGDPQKVTIFGESAGGASVGYHLLLPTSLDLFQNGILQSGSAINMWAIGETEEALKTSLLLAERAGCPIQENNRGKTIKCLQDINVDKLLDVMLTIEDRPMKIAFKPVVDGKFLPSHPADLLAKGKFCGEKNILLGFTKNDGAFCLAAFAPHLQLKEDSVYTEEQIRHAMSYLTKHNKDLTDLQVDMVKFMYTDWGSLPEDRISARKELVDFFTDRWIACPVINTANKMAAKGNKVFMYRFDHVLENQTAFLKLPSWTGSIHGDELPFVFGHALKDTEGEEVSLSKRVMRYWANFARHGDPNDDYLQDWPEYTTQHKLRLQIDGKALVVDKTDRLKECAFWDEIFPLTEPLTKNEL